MDRPAYPAPGRDHVFLGAGHAANERRTWWVVWLCVAMMVIEIVGGWLFGSLALLADGLHMSTHAGALLLAALAYSFARRHAHDPRFAFGTGKLGDLAGFSSAVVLAMIAALIVWEAASRMLHPVRIDFAQAIPIAFLGLAVNLASAWLLGGGAHDHHPHDHGHDHAHAEGTNADYNMRAAYVHVLADAAVSVLAIAALLSGRFLGWVWMDPVMGVIGALVIVSWSRGLLRDTGAVLLDMTPDGGIPGRIRAALETDGAKVSDLHVWRLGPGHLGAVVSVATARPRPPADYKLLLAGITGLSHVTVEVEQR